MSSHTAPPAAKRRRKIAGSIADGSLVQFYSKSKDVDDLGLGMAGWRKVLSNFHMGVISVVSPHPRRLPPTHTHVNPSRHLDPANGLRARSACRSPTAPGNSPSCSPAPPPQTILLFLERQEVPIGRALLPRRQGGDSDQQAEHVCGL